MRISQLETFLAVAKHRNFTKASRVCHLVQSTISHQISSLEDELGFMLFERDSHSVTLTQAGEQFYRDIEAPLELLHQAVRRGQAVAAGESGSLSVGVSAINQINRMNSVRRFRERNPGVALSYSRVGSRNILRRLDEGAYDIALISVPDHLPPEYCAVDVCNERMYLVTGHSHPAAAFNRLTLKAAQGYLMLFARDNNLSEEENRQSYQQSFGLNEINPDNIILTEDMDIMQLMLEMGEGVALVPESIIGYMQKVLKVIELVDPPPNIEVGWIYRRDNPNPVLHQFALFLSKNHVHG